MKEVIEKNSKSEIIFDELERKLPWVAKYLQFVSQTELSIEDCKTFASLKNEPLIKFQQALDNLIARCLKPIAQYQQFVKELQKKPPQRDDHLRFTKELEAKYLERIQFQLETKTQGLYKANGKTIPPTGLLTKKQAATGFIKDKQQIKNNYIKILNEEKSVLHILSTELMESEKSLGVKYQLNKASLEKLSSDLKKIESEINTLIQHKTPLITNAKNIPVATINGIPVPPPPPEVLQFNTTKKIISSTKPSVVPTSQPPRYDPNQVKNIQLKSSDQRTVPPIPTNSTSQTAVPSGSNVVSTPKENTIEALEDVIAKLGAKTNILENKNLKLRQLIEKQSVVITFYETQLKILTKKRDVVNQNTVQVTDHTPVLQQDSKIPKPPPPPLISSEPPTKRKINKPLPSLPAKVNVPVNSSVNNSQAQVNNEMFRVLEKKNTANKVSENHHETEKREQTNLLMQEEQKKLDIKKRKEKQQEIFNKYKNSINLKLNATKINEEKINLEFDKEINQLDEHLEKKKVFRKLLIDLEKLEAQTPGAKIRLPGGNDDWFLNEALEQASIQKASPAVMGDLKIISQFIQDKIKDAETKNFSPDEKNQYVTSLNDFYEGALKIRVSSEPSIQIQKTAMMKLAHDTFKHRHEGRRILADIVMMIGTLFAGLGLVIGIARVLSNRTFFFSDSHAATQRETDFNALLKEADKIDLTSNASLFKARASV